MTLCLLADRMPVDQLGKFRPELLAFLAREYPGAVVGKKKIHFCGVVSPRAGESFLFLPRGAGENETGRAASLVMRTLARFGEEVQSRVGTARMMEMSPVLLPRSIILLQTI